MIPVRSSTIPTHRAISHGLRRSAARRLRQRRRRHVLVGLAAVWICAGAWVVGCGGERPQGRSVVAAQPEDSPPDTGPVAVDGAPPVNGRGREPSRRADDAPAEGLALIDTADLRANLAVLAADSLQGRRAGTAGADEAARFLAGRLEELGVEPAGDGSSYLQRFQMPSAPGGPPDSTQNVVAIVPGADPKLAGEYVALGAHYDHLGIGAPLAGDSIYNGADDDGSGTAALLEVAEALARGPKPKRSVLIVFHGGEEEGLLGSFHFTLSPTVPRDSIVAQLNVDMIGRNAPDSVGVIGAGRISSELDEIIRRQADEEGIHLDFSWDAPDHPERLYYRSDHYNYAQYGIPVAFFFAGLHPDYHRPSDEIDKIDFGKVERGARLLYRVTWEIAERPERLKRDRLQP